MKNPHDRYFKKTFEDIEVAKDYLINYVPKNITKLVDINSLSHEKESFIDKELEGLYTDILFKTYINGKEGHQDPYFLSISIKDNLKLANPNATNKELEEACKIACIHDYIDSLKNKYNTILGENGVNLSGGQKQRLAIARVILRRSKIILFDEATSALDNESQAKIKSAIDNISKNHTILIIAHKLMTILEANKIIVIDDGKVVGYGTHRELMKRNPTYQKLYENEINTYKVTENEKIFSENL
jgi:ABC-type multidrug transport system ATPase subunit